MRKFLVTMGLVAFAVVGCDDNSSASAGSNDEPGVESSSSVERGESSSSVIPGSDPESSNSEKAKSSSSDTQSDAKQSSSGEKDKSSSSSAEVQSSSSEKSEKSSSSVDNASSSSVKSESSSSVEDLQSSSSEKEKSSSSVTPQSSSSSTSVSSSSASEQSSSSSEKFDWSVPKEAYLNPEIEYDSIVDSRDGKVYKTVKIGDQTWMAENLNFDPGQGGSGEDKYDWSWCYNDEPKNCDVAGRLYTWAAAIDSVKLANDTDNPQNCGRRKTCTLPAKVQGLCDKGWHLPTNAEWSALFTAAGDKSTAGKVLKSQTGWYSNGNGTDSFGFSALPAGSWYKGDFFVGEGYSAYFWGSTERDSYDAYHMHLYDDRLAAGLFALNKDYGFSVRCVKD